MSMLAEPRRKANWVLNPRNNHWTADNSKFGLRLMEKMGWTEGSGLGANEQGSTEHIKVSVRSDNRGVGFKDRPEDELVHQSEFSDLLQQLASSTPPLEGSGDENKSAAVTSLEEKSQKSRSRVHYKKFTRGKDLSRYSEKDLASILGKPAPVKNSTIIDNEEKKESTFESDVVTIGGGNMLDYFRKKMAGFQSEEGSGDASRSEEICADNGRKELNGTENNIAETNGVKKKKKSKRNSKDVENSTCEAKSEGVTNTGAETRKERKRRRKAEEALNISEQEIEMKNSSNDKDENSTNCNLNLSSTSEGCDDAEKDPAGGTETKKEKKRRRKAEKAVKILEQQVEVEDAASFHINAMNQNGMESKHILKSADDQHRKPDEEDNNDTEAHANNKKEKKRKQKVERALENGQGRAECEITTNSAESSSNQTSNKMSNSEWEESMQAEDEEKLVEKKLKKRKIKTMNVEEDRPVQNQVELIEGKKADDLCSKETKTKKSRKECDQGTIELVVKNDVNSSKIKNKKSKRKLEDDINLELIPSIEAEEGKNREGKKEFLDNFENSVEDAEQKFQKKNKHKKRKTNQGVEIEPEVFQDARSKKAKKKGKLHKFPESSENVPESLSEFVDDSKEEVGFSAETKKENMLEQMDQQTSDSNAFENTTEGLRSFESTVKEKKVKKRKEKSREAPCSEMLEETTCVLSEEVECFVETKKERKRKRKDTNPPGTEIIEETSDICAEDAVCDAELNKETKHKREDKFLASTSKRITDENGTLAEEMVLEDCNQGLKIIENIDVVSAELISRGNVVGNVTGTLKTREREKAIVPTLNQGEQISSTINTTVIDDVTQNIGSGFTKQNATKKPVPIVELNGKVYINGICNFNLSHPEINNAELKKIPLHLRQDVEFLPIPGANVDEFGYVGLKFHK